MTEQRHRPNRRKPLFLLLAAALLLSSAPHMASAQADEAGMRLPESKEQETWYQRQKVKFQNRNVMKQAQAALDAQKWVEAEQLLRQALKNDTGNTYIRVSLVNCYYNLERWDEGIFLCDALIRSHPEYVDASFYKAYMAMRANRDELAIEAFEGLAEKAPKNVENLNASTQDLAGIYEGGTALLKRLPEICRGLAELYLRNGDLPKAESNALKWAKLDDSAVAQLFLAEIAIRSENWDRATTRLNKAQALASTHKTRGTIALKKGYIYTVQGDLKTAEEELTTAEDLLRDPDLKQQATEQLGEVAMRRGLDAYDAGDMAAAQTHYHTAFERVTDPKKKNYVRKQLGQVALRGDNPNDAVVLLAEALEVDFDTNTALAYLEALNRDGKFERGAKVSRGYLERKTLSKEFRRSVNEYLMRFYERLDDDERYHAMAAALHTEYPDHAPYTVELAVASKRIALIDASIALYQEYLDQNFAPGAALDLYYLSLVAKKDVGAEELLGKILATPDLEPTLAVTTKYELAQVYRRGERTDEYLALMEEVVAARPEADLLFEYGVQLYAAELDAEAIAAFKKSFELQSNKDKRFMTAKVIANLYFARSEFEAADTWLQEALSHGTADLEWHLTSGRVKYARGQYSECVDLLLTQDQKNDEINMLLGFSYYRLDYPGLALYHFDQIADPEQLQSEERATFYGNRAHLRFDQDRFDLSAKDAKSAVELRYSPTMTMVESKSHLALQQPDAAIGVLTPMLESERPEDTNAVIRADLLRTLGQAFFMRAAAGVTNPDKGIGRAQEKDFEQSVAYYTEAIATGEVTPDIYYSRAIAYMKLEDFDAAVEDFDMMKELSPQVPGVFYGDYATAQGERKEYEAGTEAMATSLQAYPYDIDAREEAGFQFIKWKKNTEAMEQFDEAIRISDMVLPYVDEDELERYVDDNTFVKRETAFVNQNWGAQAYVYRTEFGDDEVESAAGGFTDIEGILASQLGAEIWWRPPKYGFRDHKLLDVFVRFLANFEPNSWTPNEDTYQLGVGFRYKPFKWSNYRIGIEKLIAIGDAAEDNTLWRNALAYEVGERPKKIWEWGFTGRSYFEASYYMEPRKRWVYFADLKVGPNLNFADILLVQLPQAKLIWRHETGDESGVGSYIYYGLGLEARALDPETKKETENFYLDFFVHYVIGEFTDEPVKIEDDDQDFEGLIFGLTFVK